MRENFTLLGHTQPQLFYTDNVVGDQRFLESGLPSLKDSVEHFKKSRSENIEDAKGLQEIVFPSNIKPKTIKEAEEINNIANEILSLAETSRHVYVDFDCEWLVKKIRGARRSKISIVQVAYLDKVYVFQIKDYTAATLPESLKKLVDRLVPTLPKFAMIIK
jgi:hypothetical protein